MIEDLITFETAKLAKEKGFNIPTIDLWYREDNNTGKIHKGKARHQRYINCSKMYSGSNVGDYEESEITIEDIVRKPSDYPAEKKLYPAPSQSVLQKWLREIYNIHVTTNIYNCSVKTTFYRSRITYFKDNLEQNKYRGLGKYEQAFEIGLQEALKLI